jgi:hypothetical protein
MPGLIELTNPKDTKPASKPEPKNEKTAPGGTGLLQLGEGIYSGLFTSKDNKSTAPKEKKEDPYEAQENERVRRYLDEWNRLTDMSRAALAWSKMPQSVELRTEKNSRQLELSCNRFSAFFEGVPGLKLDKPARDFLEGMKKVKLDDNQLKLEGKTSFKTEGGLSVNLSNPSVEITPDPTDTSKFHLRNIKGIDCAGILAIREAELTVTKGDAGQFMKLQVSVKNPVDKPLRASFAALGVPQEDYIKLDEIPLGKPESVLPIVAQMREKPGNRDYVRMAEALTSSELPKELRDLIGSITGRSKHGDEVEITRTGPSHHDLGGLTVDLKDRIKAKVSITDKEAKLENIDGVDFKVPLPPEVKKLLGMNGIESKLKEMSLSAEDGDGNRAMRVKFDSNSLVESMEIKVNKDLRPVLDKQGRLTIDVVAAREMEIEGKRETIRLPLQVSFDPKQIENPPKQGPDFTIRLTGQDKDYIRIAENILPGVNLNEVKDYFQGVKSISKKGDSIVIERAGKTSRDLGGLSLDADTTVSFAVRQDKNVLKIADIAGVTLTLKPDMPEAVKKYLGLDIGHIPVGIKNISLVDEGEGKQRVIVEGNNLLSKVAVHLKDGKPMLEPDGRWKLYAMVQCPPGAEERRLGKPLREMGIILPFNKDNQVDLKAEETAALVAQVAFQNIDPEDPKTWGLGLVAVGSQVASQAIETGKDLKARFDDGVRQIGDGTATERFKDGLRQIGDGRATERFKDGCSQLPGRFESGLKRIGGWLGLD